MPHLIITNPAIIGMERCRQFLAAKSPRAAKRALQAITKQLDVLRTMPDVGRFVAEFPGQRELVIDFGDSGYVARYRFLPDRDTVYVLTFRHQKEVSA